MTEVSVLVLAKDPLTRTTVRGYLDNQPDLTVVEDRCDPADVVVTVVDRLSPEVAFRLRGEDGCGAPVVLVVGEIERSKLLLAVECNVVALLPRRTVTGEMIESAVRTAASGGAMLPSDVLGDLLAQFRWLQDQAVLEGVHSSGLGAREIEVVRLMSDGFDTEEIAQKLSFSERAIKRIVTGMTQRLGLRNRPHVVAYALRTGAI